MSERRGLMSVSASGGELTDFKVIVGLNPTIQNMFFPDSIKTFTFERRSNATAYTGGRLVVSALYGFSRTSNLETLTIDYGVVKPTSAMDTFRFDNTNGTASLKTIHFYVDTSAVTTWDRFFYAGTQDVMHNLVIDGTPIDFEKMTKWTNVLDMRGISEIRFVPDKIKATAVTIANTYTVEYSADTWVSLVNALYNGTAGTFTIGSTAIATITAITGDNDSGLFVLSDSGAMTLYDFATTVKGWTLA